ncbi:PAS domain-containing sensor histidine kinase [Hymenobacter tibetensis]|uniref:histidine kinase n=1 Tax=Hymenobacter tibetensis TaxID=497967 RepID=A0ABY4CYR7_9BACT|nr:PAS domain-containing sensor histidine kinase [Hymenobacter tibetensis]UOG75408.1 PAS domain-containing sensor histidine kinase [Hymenobacter tibetensis]
MPDYPLLFRTWLDRSSTVYFAYDVAERRVAYVSPAYEQVIGGTAADVNEDLPTWLAQIHPDDRQLLNQQLELVLGNDLVQNVEVRVLHSEEETQWLELSACKEQLPDGTLYLTGTIEDISRAKADSLNAQKFNAKKNATLEILSHDLATPFVLLQQLTQHLKSQFVATDETNLHLIGLMERTCSDGLTLIREFVDQEFLESASIQLKRERTNLVDWIGTILEEYQRSARRTDLRFEFRALAQTIYVSLDVNKFEQVINNLISNAIKFTPDGGTIAVEVSRRNGWAVVTVADSGIGIPEHLHPVLFDKFTKARRPGLRGEKTTGLGMSVIQTLVELHEGSIRFVSAENQGTTFTIEIPALPA